MRKAFFAIIGEASVYRMRKSSGYQEFLAYVAAVGRKTMERRGNLGRPFLMVYYEETKLISNWQLKYSFSSLLRRGSFSGETARKRGIKKSGTRGGALNFSSPHSPYRKDERELCGGESTFSAILVQQQNIPLYFSFPSQVVSYILVTQITTLHFTESPET